MTKAVLDRRRGWSLTRVGLKFLRDLTVAEWQACGRHIAAMGNATAWAIGDWLVYGEGRDEYGRTYEAAAEETGKSFDSLSQYARVSRAFPADQRVPHVSWTLHREALRLPDSHRHAALATAAAQRWSRADLSAHIEGVQAPLVAQWHADPAQLAGEMRKKVHRWKGAQRPLSERPRIACPNCGYRIEAATPGAAEIVRAALAEKAMQPTTIARHMDAVREAIRAGATSGRAIRQRTGLSKHQVREAVTYLATRGAIRKLGARRGMTYELVEQTQGATA